MDLILGEYLPQAQCNQGPFPPELRSFCPYINAGMKVSTEPIVFGNGGGPAVDVKTPAIITTRKAFGTPVSWLCRPLTIVHNS